MYHYTFSEALIFIKAGKSVTREGWNGEGMSVTTQFPAEHSKMTQPYLYIEAPTGARIPWFPSTADLFASDWTMIPANAP